MSTLIPKSDIPVMAILPFAAEKTLTHLKNWSQVLARPLQIPQGSDERSRRMGRMMRRTYPLLLASIIGVGCSAEYAGEGYGSGAPSSSEIDDSSISIAHGEMTAGDWDDNLNFDLFSDYTEDFLEGTSFDPNVQWSFERRELELSPSTQLDLAFVIDVTGSMCDELSYVQNELQSILDMVVLQLPDVDTRVAYVVYRDHGDAYVTRSQDFSSDISAVADQLMGESCGGGGDYPEAMDEALGAANQLSWREGDVTGIIFLIADAPAHNSRVGAFMSHVADAAQTQTRIYPVAASGASKTAEFLMRAAAQATAARYIFLTDDSGIGLDHEEPTIPCYLVQYLNQLMVRMIVRELTGMYDPPESDEILRAVGEPDEGACALEDGTTARLW